MKSSNCIFLFLLNSLSFTIAFSQSNLSAEIYVVPTLFKSNELVYEYYYGEKSQFYFSYGAQIQYSLFKQKAFVGIGMNYFQRKIEETCVVVPNINDAPTSLDIRISNRNNCTHLISGKSNIINIPFHLGYNWLNKKKVKVYTEMGIGPLVQLNRQIIMNNNTSIERTSLEIKKDRILSWQNIYFSSGIEYEISESLSIVTSPIFSIDNLKVRTNKSFGVLIGVKSNF